MNYRRKFDLLLLQKLAFQDHKSNYQDSHLILLSSYYYQSCKLYFHNYSLIVQSSTVKPKFCQVLQL